jgi:hypothetical protein
MNTQDDTVKSVDTATNAHEYAAPAVLSAVKVTDVVRGGTGFASDGGNFLPL